MNRIVIVAAGVIALALSGCTGDDPAPSSSASASTTAGSTASADPGITREELQAQVFAPEAGSTDPIVSVTGAVPDPASPLPARIDVTEVVADESSTVVRFTLVNTEGTDPLVQMSAFNEAKPLTNDIRDVALVDLGASLRFQPYVGVPTDTSQASICTCSNAPLQMSGAGQLPSATFPALAPTTTAVTVEIPGFPPAENVPVTRR